MSTTASTIAQGALELIGVLGANETMNASQGQDALRRLNLMVGSWSLQPGTIPTIAREVFDMTAGKGSPTNPYTVGLTGDLVTARPAMGSLVGAAYLLTGSSPNPIENPVAVYTNDAYQSLQVKDLSNTLISGVFYRPDSPLGKLFTFPVVDTAENDLVLYLRKPFTRFADLTTAYDFPEGAEEALEYNLAKRLMAPYSVPPIPDVVQMAAQSLGIFKRSNYKLFDLPQDPALTHSHGGYYNIVTGNG